MYLPQSTSINSFAWMLYKNYPKQIILAGFLLIIAAVLELISLSTLLPILFSLTDANASIDNKILSQLLEYLYIPSAPITYLLLIMCCLMICRGIILFITNYSIGLLAIKLEKNLRDSLLKIKLNGNWSYQTNTSDGNFVNIITQQASLCAMAVNQFSQFFTATVTAIILLISSLILSWKAFLIFVISCTPYLLLSRFINGSSHKASKAYNLSLGNSSNDAIEINNLTKFYKANALEQHAHENFAHNLLQLEQSHTKLALNKSIIYAYPEAFGIVTLSILLSIAHHYDVASTNELIMFLIIMYRAYMQISRQQTSKNTLIRQIPSFKLVKDFIQTAAKAAEHNNGQSTKIFNSSPLLSLRKISARYENNADNTLNQIDLNINQNEIIAIVGKSGAGKTTLIDCILNLTEPHEGEIIMNGQHNIKTLNAHAYRSNFSYLPQDSFLISGTIRENIELGNPNISAQELDEIIEMTGLQNMIKDLENGLETQINGVGTSISGGQKQRIALARALAKSPSILILDEPTSALDVQTAKTIQSTLKKLKEKCSIILVTHTLSHLEITDKIYLLENGSITHQGSPEAMHDILHQHSKLN